MQNQIRSVRLAITAVGLLAVMLSLIVIFRTITELHPWQGDALSDASVVAVLLGILLAVGGSCLVVRGIKHGSRAA